MATAQRDRLQWLIGLFACLLLGSFFVLQSEEAVLSEMAFGGCDAGGPAKLQGGLGGADDDEVAEIVTGWYLAIRVESALQANPAAEIPTACPKPAAESTVGEPATDDAAAAATDSAAAATDTAAAATDTATDAASDGATPAVTESASDQPAVTESASDQPVVDPVAGPDLDVGRHVAHVWLLSDAIGFAPIYGVLLTLVIVGAWRRRDEPARSVHGYAMKLATHPRRLITLVWLGVLCDLDENRALAGKIDDWWRILGRNPDQLAASLHADDLDRFGVWLVGWVKWLALAPALFVAVLMVVHAAKATARRYLTALPELWVQLLAVVVFAIVWMGPLDQGADAIRRMSVVQWGGAFLAISFLAAALALTGSRSLRYVDPSTDGGSGPAPAPIEPQQTVLRVDDQTWWRRLRHRPTGVIISGAGALLIWVAPHAPGTRHLEGLPHLGKIVLVIGLTSLAVDLVQIDATATTATTATAATAATAATTATAAKEREDSARRLVAARAVAPLLAGALFLVFGIAALRATAGDLAYSGAGVGSNRARRLVGGYMFVIAAPFAVSAARRLIDDVTEQSRRRARVLAALAVLFGSGVIMHSPRVNLDLAHRVGTAVVLCVFLGGFSLIGSIADQLTQRLIVGPKGTGHPRAEKKIWGRQVLAHLALPSSIRLLRIRSTPVVGILVAWAVLATGSHLDGYHSIRRVGSSVASGFGPTELATSWVGRHPAPAGGDATTAPALLVAASGGGIRAAYWTAKVVDCLIERDPLGGDPCGKQASAATVVRRRHALMLMSGASGGSLGLAEYVATVGDRWSMTAADGELRLADDWVATALGSDFLAPVASTWWFTDGINTFLRPTSGVDRGAMLERAWESSNESMLAAFFTTQRTGEQPILLMNGYSAQTGCRMLTSSIQLVSSGPAADCTSPAATTPQRDAAGSSDAADAFAIPATIDFRSFCAHEDVRFSTAALNSARFPVVSPAGHLEACTADGAALDPSPSAEVVDGGYRENTGASTIVEMWPQLRAALADAMADETQPAPFDCVAPIFIQIDNGYHDRSPTAATDTSSSGVLTPAVAQLHLSKGIEATAQQQAYLDFAQPTGQQLWFHIQTFTHPGAAAPLGWVLSEDAQRDLDAELANNATAFGAIRSLLDAPSTLPCVLPAS